MLTLLLLRHAKSSWDDIDTEDHDRPLAERGRHAAPLLGSYIARSNLVPDLILCSTSARTRETVDLVVPFFERRPEIRYEPALYLADEATLLSRLHSLTGDNARVLMVGHNPGFEDFARNLSADGDASALEKLGEKFPTAALAVITLPFETWANVSVGSGTLRSFVTPKQLGASFPVG